MAFRWLEGGPAHAEDTPALRGRDGDRLWVEVTLGSWDGPGHPRPIRQVSTDDGPTVALATDAEPEAAEAWHEGRSYLLQGAPQSLHAGAVTAAWRLPEADLVLVAASLAGRTFHPLGQTERRRSEARLINREIRQLLNRPAERPQILLVVASVQDHPESAAWREFTDGFEPRLIQRTPEAPDGSRWTRRSPGPDVYERLDGVWAGITGGAGHITADLVPDPDGGRWVRVRWSAADGDPAPR